MAVDFISLLICRVNVRKSSSSGVDFYRRLRRFVITSIGVHVLISHSLLNFPNIVLEAHIIKEKNLQINRSYKKLIYTVKMVWKNFFSQDV